MLRRRNRRWRHEAQVQSRCGPRVVQEWFICGSRADKPRDKKTKLPTRTLDTGMGPTSAKQHRSDMCQPENDVRTTDRFARFLDANMGPYSFYAWAAYNRRSNILPARASHLQAIWPSGLALRGARCKSVCARGHHREIELRVDCRRECDGATELNA